MNAQRHSLVIGAVVWVLVLGGLAAWLGVELWSTHVQARQQIESIEPRMARLLGLGSDKARLETAARDLRAQAERHAYPATRDATQAGNDAQQRVRDLLTRAGLDVLQIQVLPPRQAGAFDRIPIALRCEGELAAVHAALAALSSSAPSLFVEGFSMQGSAAPDARAQRVATELQLFVLRARA